MPSLKKLITEKRVGGVAQGVGPEFKARYRKKKKKKCHIFLNVFFSCLKDLVITNKLVYLLLNQTI
jgi:hypothetical protein